jgi:hypothetical protein
MVNAPIPEGFDLLVGRGRDNALKAIALAEERGFDSTAVRASGLHNGFLVPLPVSDEALEEVDDAEDELGGEGESGGDVEGDGDTADEENDDLVSGDAEGGDDTEGEADEIVSDSADGEPVELVATPLEDLTVPELKNLAKRQEIDLGAATKKPDIIAVIEASDKIPVLTDQSGAEGADDTKED